MSRICCSDDHITGCRSKRACLSGQYHVNIQVFDVSSWLSLLSRSCPESCRQLKRFVRKWKVPAGRCRGKRFEPRNADGLTGAEQLALELVVDNRRDNYAVPTMEAPRQPLGDGYDFSVSLRMCEKTKWSRIKDDELAHGKSRRAPVAARLAFIDFLNSAISSSASRSSSGSVVASWAFQAARSSSVAVSAEPPDRGSGGSFSGFDVDGCLTSLRFYQRRRLAKSGLSARSGLRLL